MMAEIRVCLMEQAVRDHGWIFADLRDRDGLTQVVFSPDIAPAAHENAHILRSEYVLAIRGKVRPRPDGMVNANMVTGQIEIVVCEWCFRSIRPKRRPSPSKIAAMLAKTCA